MTATASRNVWPLSLVVAIALSGCGGGGAHGSPALPATSGPSSGTSAGTAPAGQTTASVAIDIPARTTAASNKRSTAYVSPSVESIVISAVGGGKTTANVTAGSAGCVAQTPQIAQFNVTESDTRDYLPGGVPGSLVAGPDGNVWFTYAGSNSSYGAVYSVSPSGAFSEYKVGYVPSGIVVGPGGALWTVTVRTTPYIDSKLVSITPGSGVTLYEPAVFASGSLAYAGGQLYVPIINFGQGYSYGITTGPAVNTIVTGATSFVPQATAPDGSVWGVYSTVSSQFAGKLSGTTPVSYDVGYSVQNIVTGPDGNMWFIANENHTGTVDHVIGKVALDGTQAVAYPVSQNVVGLSAGPDGNVWFIEQQVTTKIARITPSGAITEFSLPYAANGVTAGPDGNIWISEVGTSSDFGHIARLTPPGSECTLTVNVPLPASASSSGSTVTATAYSGLNGTGAVLGIASMPFTATAAGPNVIAFTLNGVVANVKVTAPPAAALTIGQSTAIPLQVSVFDAAGNIIIPPGSYVDVNGNALTITLTDSDTSGQTGFTGNSITGGPGVASPTLTYTGAGAVTAVLSATVTGGTISGSVTGTTLTAH